MHDFGRMPSIHVANAGTKAVDERVYVDRTERTIFVADAHQGDGKRFVVRAEEKLTVFVELESAVRPCRELP